MCAFDESVTARVRVHVVVAAVARVNIGCNYSCNVISL